MKINVYTAIIVTCLLAWNFYQDFPSVTGFYDHTVACK
jgi:hypothetical protein